ncbi:hypothetical protein [Novosphingobium sp. SG720]|uniref:hypothetical protein n=1 Tax=Novosphingobium sp. SG720 TaxID=2586998 RepID=UPI0014453F60|nr:hypothetical protein [Novosphingobium sp. SG720]NKJ42491.1 putative XRE-type DNA-binding protein [Novosphingobium sp. SG720]
MGKKRKRQAEKAADEGFAGAVMALLGQAMGDSAVARCTLSIDKIAGLARLATSAADGRTATRDIIGPGLTLPEPVADAPEAPAALAGRGAAARAARDASIVALAARGLTQTETARVLSVSQALVSKVLRASTQDRQPRAAGRADQ